MGERGSSDNRSPSFKLDVDLETLLASAIDGMVATDHNGIVVAYNKACERLFGYTPDEVIGEDVAMLMDYPHRSAHKEYIRRYCETRLPRVIGLDRIMEGRRKDGSRFPFQLAVVELGRKPNQFFVGFVHDVSHQVQAEALQRRFRDFAECASDWLWETDEANRFVWLSANVERLLGTRREKIYGLTRQDLMGPGTDEAMIEKHEQAIERKEPFREIEFSAQPPLAERWISTSGVPVFNETGRFTGYRGIARDITRRKHSQLKMYRINTELSRLNGDLEDFAYIVSHDLRAPLRGINLLVGWLKEAIEQHDEAQAFEHIDAIIGRTARMQTLIRDLLDYARLGRSAEQSVPIDIPQLLRKTVELLGIPNGFTVAIETEVTEMVGQTTPLETVFRNLIANAISHHDRDHGRITIRNRKKGETIEFSVSDDGPGIPDERKDLVFGLFKRFVDDPAREGTGMGLSVVKRLVNLHHGEITVHDAEGGRGTDFRFTWPADIGTDPLYANDNRA